MSGVVEYRTLLAVGLALVVVSPVVTAQETELREDILAKEGEDITFYGHIFAFGRGSPLPMNTQFPEGAEDYSIGTGGGCGNPPPAPDDSADCRDWESNESWWYTTAGFVQVKDWESWGSDYSKFHNERGQTKDIYLDTDKTATYTLYMSADFHGWPAAACGVLCWNWDPGVFQDWTVESWIWHASLGDWSSDPSAKPSIGKIADCFESMEWDGCDGVTLVAHGMSEPKDMQSVDSTVPVAGGQTVHDFSADYEWNPSFVESGGVVPYQNDLVVQFEWFQYTDGQKYLLQTPVLGTVWNLNGGEDYPPTVVLPTRNPIDVELVFPRFVHDKLVVLSIINTPWGSYDIDPELTTMTIRDASGDEVDIDPETLQSDVDSSVAHAGHYKPINATWVWDYQAQGLAPGEYTVTVEATNFQHSYTTSTTASFSVAADGENTATAGRSGLASYSDSDFEAFKEGAGIGAGTDDQETASDDVGGEAESQDSPGLAAMAAALLTMVAVAVVRRRR